MQPTGTLSLAFGPMVVQPAPPAALEMLESVTVRHADTGRSGFQLSFRVQRTRGLGLADLPPFERGWLQVGHRVQIGVTIRGTPHPLMDGIVTNQQVAPSEQPGTSTFTVTGEDVSVMMDLTELRFPWPASDYALVNLLIGSFAAYGLVPLVVPPLADFFPNPVEEVPHVQGTPLAMVQSKARQHDYVFYVDPGPVLGVNTAYFGPRIRAGIPQKALTVGMGGLTNVTSMSFGHDGTKPEFVVGLVKDDNPNLSAPPLPVIPVPVLGQPMAARPSLFTNAPFVHTRFLDPLTPAKYLLALLKASTETSRSAAAAATANGEVDVGRYGTVLKARTVVAVRGAGDSFDGDWYVQSVNHTIKRGEYRQSFSLEREGLGSLRRTVSA